MNKFLDRRLENVIIWCKENEGMCCFLHTWVWNKPTAIGWPWSPAQSTRPHGPGKVPQWSRMILRQWMTLTEMHVDVQKSLLTSGIPADSEKKCCCCSVAKSCPTLCDSMDCSTPGFPVLHYLPEFAQIHVHWVSDAISSHLILCHPFSYCTSVFPSIRVFTN